VQFRRHTLCTRSAHAAAGTAAAPAAATLYEPWCTMPPQYLLTLRMY
jgi:hypothetical protein